MDYTKIAKFIGGFLLFLNDMPPTNFYEITGFAASRNLNEYITL